MITKTECFRNRIKNLSALIEQREQQRNDLLGLRSVELLLAIKHEGLTREDFIKEMGCSGAYISREWKITPMRPGFQNKLTEAYMNLTKKASVKSDNK